MQGNLEQGSKLTEGPIIPNSGKFEESLESSDTMAVDKNQYGQIIDPSSGANTILGKRTKCENEDISAHDTSSKLTTCSDAAVAANLSNSEGTSQPPDLPLTAASSNCSGAPVRRVVRSRTPSACMRCKAAKAKCSEQRPCPRCLRSGDAVVCAAELGPGGIRSSALQHLAGSLGPPPPAHFGGFGGAVLSGGGGLPGLYYDAAHHPPPPPAPTGGSLPSLAAFGLYRPVPGDFLHWDLGRPAGDPAQTVSSDCHANGGGSACGANSAIGQLMSGAGSRGGGGGPPPLLPPPIFAPGLGGPLGAPPWTSPGAAAAAAGGGGGPPSAASAMLALAAAQDALLRLAALSGVAGAGGVPLGWPPQHFGAHGLGDFRGFNSAAAAVAAAAAGGLARSRHAPAEDEAAATQGSSAAGASSVGTAASGGGSFSLMSAFSDRAGGGGGGGDGGVNGGGGFLENMWSGIIAPSPIRPAPSSATRWPPPSGPSGATGSDPRPDGAADTSGGHVGGRGGYSLQVLAAVAAANAIEGDMTAAAAAAERNHVSGGGGGGGDGHGRG